MSEANLNYPAPEKHSREMLIWFLASLPVAFVTIFVHEVFHFIPAKLMGAKDVQFFWASVDYDINSISTAANAIVAIAGPLLTWSVVAVSYLLIRFKARTLPSFWLAFVLCCGLLANFRALVGIAPIIKGALGLSLEGTSFDEWGFAHLLNIPWILPVGFSLAVLIAALIYFSRQTLRLRSWRYLLTLFLGFVAGFVLFIQLGPLLLPGGQGFS